MSDQPAQKPATGNRQPATGNAEANRQQATGNRQQATGRRVDPGFLRIGSDIADRLLNLAVAVLKLTHRIKKDFAGKHVCSQITRAATSSGANYEEARASESRSDFIHKIGVAQKEIRETAYWLRIIQRAAMTDEPIDAQLREAIELSAILGASLRTARARESG